MASIELRQLLRDPNFRKTIVNITDMQKEEYTLLDQGNQESARIANKIAAEWKARAVALSGEEAIEEALAMRMSDLRILEQDEQQKQKEEQEQEQKEEGENSAMVDPFTDPKEKENWVDCWDCGKPLYLGQYSNFVGPEYLPGGKLEQDGKTEWFCTSCWDMKKSKKKLTKKVSPIKRDIIGRKVKFTRKGKEYNGVIEKITPKKYGVCCKPGKKSGDKESLYHVTKRNGYIY